MHTLTRIALLFITLAASSQSAFAGSATLLFNGVSRYNDQTPTTGRSTNGDTYRCTQAIPTLSGDEICTYNDGFGSNPGGFTQNAGLLRLHFDWTSPTNTSAVAINTLGGLGGKTQTNTNGWNDGLTWKTGGIYYQQSTNLTYLFIHRQCDLSGGCPTPLGLSAWESMQGSIIVSPDVYNGTATPHWCNPATMAAHSNVCASPWWNQNGDPPLGPTPSSDTMWPGENHAGKLIFVMFQNGDTTDNSGTWGYALAGSGDKSSTYLYRFPWTSVQTVSTWQYYKGPIGGDYVNTPANWCAGTQAACEPSQTAMGAIITNTQPPTMTHLPSPWNAYLIGFPGNEIISATGISGPYAVQTTNALPTGQVFISLLLGSLISANPSQPNGIGQIPIISGSDFTLGTANYSIYLTYMILGTPSKSFSLPSRNVPGTINASDYDYGIPEVAFHNPSPHTIYSTYRPYDGIDLPACVGCPNGVSLGSTNTGETLNYTVTPTRSGTGYTVTATVSAPVAGTGFHLMIGANNVGSFSVPVTAGTCGGSTQVTVPLGFTMPTSGNVTIKLVVDTGGFNLQSLQFN